MKQIVNTPTFAGLLPLAAFISLSLVLAQFARGEVEISADAAFAEVAQAVSADPAFDRYMSLAELGDAWRSHDAAALTDAALQIAEGERVLMRPHAQLPAEKLLSVAAKLALEKKDQETLARLKRAAEVHGKPAFAAQIAATTKLGGVARSEVGFHVSLDETSPEEYRTFRNYLDRIRSARIAGDGTALVALEAEIKVLPDLQPASRDYLLQQIKQTAANLPKMDKPDDTIAVLDRLSGASRGWFEDSTGIRTPEPIRRIAPNGISYTPNESYSTFNDPPSPPACRITNVTNSLTSYYIRRGSGSEKFFLGPKGYRTVYLPAQLTYVDGYGKSISGALKAGKMYQFQRDQNGMIKLKTQQ